MSAPEPPSLVTVLATLHAFVTHAGAERAVLVLDQGNDTHAAVVDCPAHGEAEVSEGDESVVVRRPGETGGTPLPLPEVRSFPPLAIDAVHGEVTSPLGAFEHLGRAVRDLAAVFPGRSVLTVAWASTDPDTSLSLAARAGEEMVLILGEEQFELPAGWPGPGGGASGGTVR